METTFLRFVLAAAVTSVYGVACIFIWGAYFEGPHLSEASAYQWGLTAVVVFMLVCLFGGLLTVGTLGTRVPSWFLVMGFYMACLWGFQPLGPALIGNGFNMDMLVSTVLRTGSIMGAVLAFNFIALKPAEAEAA